MSALSNVPDVLEAPEIRASVHRWTVADYRALAEAGQVEVYRRPQAGAYREGRLYGRGEVIGAAEVTGGAVAVETLFA